MCNISYYNLVGTIKDVFERIKKVRTYRNQSIDMLCKSMDLFLCDRDLHHESVDKFDRKITQVVSSICQLHYDIWHKLKHKLKQWKNNDLIKLVLNVSSVQVLNFVCTPYTSLKEIKY